MASITLRNLFDVLSFECTDTDPFTALALLRDPEQGGLRIAVGTLGTVGENQPLHHGDVSAALAKVAREYRDEQAELLDRNARRERICPARDNELRERLDIWRHEVTVCAGTLDKYSLPVGDLWISEADYAAACRRLGMESYRWPSVPGQIMERSLAMRTLSCVHNPKMDGFTLEEAADSMANQYGWHDGQKKTTQAPSTALERRTRKLLKWLDEQGVPEDKRNPLQTGWILRDIFDELKKFDEFQPQGLHMEFSTFVREFWRVQTFVKLPRGRKKKSGET